MLHGRLKLCCSSAMDISWSSNTVGASTPYSGCNSKYATCQPTSMLPASLQESPNDLFQGSPFPHWVVLNITYLPICSEFPLVGVMC